MRRETPRKGGGGAFPKESDSDQPDIGTPKRLLSNDYAMIRVC